MPRRGLSFLHNPHVRTPGLHREGRGGKTSVAAATAVRCAELGYRTVVLSTDLAHSLADSLDVPLGRSRRQCGREPVGTGDGYLQQPADALGKASRNGSARCCCWAGTGRHAVVADELTVLPGMDELANLLWINSHRESGAVRRHRRRRGADRRDAAAALVSGHHALVDGSHLPVERRAMGVALPTASSTFVDMPLPSDKVYREHRGFFPVGSNTLHRYAGALPVPHQHSAGAPIPRRWSSPRRSARAPTSISSATRWISSSPTACCRRGPRPSPLEGDPGAVPEPRRRGLLPRSDPAGPALRRRGTRAGALGRMAEDLYADEDPAPIFYRGRARCSRRFRWRLPPDAPLPFRRTARSRCDKPATSSSSTLVPTGATSSCRGR